MDWKQLGKAAKKAAASIEDAARKAAPHIEEAAAKAAAHIKEAEKKARPHLQDAARKTVAAAKEVQKRIDRADPAREALKRVLRGVLKDWLDGDIDWIDEDNDGAGAAEAKPTGASIAVSLRKGEIELRRVQLKARCLDAVGAPGLYLVSGSVDHAKIVLPWAQLGGSKPAKVAIGALSLRLRATRDDDITSMEPSAAERREDSLDAMRAQWTAFAEQTAARRLDRTGWSITVDEASVAWEIPGGADATAVVRNLAVQVADGEQLKQSIATVLSLNGGAPARPPPRRRAEVEVVVPASHEKLGFSVTSTGGRLVVISVRDASPLAMRGVEPGARLLTLNGEDVAHCSPVELSARAASLAGVERVVVLAVDDVGPPPPPPGGASF